MEISLKEFIEANIDLIDNNQFELLYHNFRTEFRTKDWGMLSDFLFRAGINPLNYLEFVPKFFLYGTGNTKELVIPNHVTKIYARAFEKAHSLTSIQLSPYITNIEQYAFMECINLRTIKFPSMIESLGESAFEHCSMLYNVDCSSELAIIPYRCFYYCSSLRNVTLPYGVVEIGQDAFRYCTSLESIEIPVHVTKLGNRCFADSGLKQIIFNGTKRQWKSIHKYSTWCQGVPQGILVKCTDGTLLESFYD